MTPTIYRIDFPTGDFYIGATVNFSSRRRTHLRAFRAQHAVSSKLAKAFAAHSVCGIYEIASGFGRETLHLLEAEVIAQERPTLNVNPKPTKLPGYVCGKSTPFGPHESLKDAAKALGVGYGAVKSAAKKCGYDYGKFIAGLDSRTCEKPHTYPPDPRKNTQLMLLDGAWVRVSDVCRSLGITAKTASRRRSNGWSFEDSFKPRVGPQTRSLKNRLCDKYGVWTTVFDARRKRGWNTLQALGLRPGPVTEVKVRERIYEAGGHKKTLKQWAKQAGVPVQTLHARIYNKWSPEQVVGLEKSPSEKAKEAAHNERARLARLKHERNQAKQAEKEKARREAGARRQAKTADLARRVAAKRAKQQARPNWVPPFVALDEPR